MTFDVIAQWLNKEGYLTVRGKRFKGAHVHSILKKRLAKEELLKLPISELKNRLRKKESAKFNWMSFLFWCFMSIVLSLFPLLVLIGYLLF